MSARVQGTGKGGKPRTNRKHTEDYDGKATKRNSKRKLDSMKERTFNVVSG
jgi:hypothetical protein